MPVPDFNNDQRTRLLQLQLGEPQIQALRLAIHVARLATYPAAPRNPTKRILDDIAKHASRLSETLQSMLRGTDAAHSQVNAEIAQRFFEDPRIEEVTAATVAHSLCERLDSLADAAKSARLEVPSGPAHSRTADPSPIYQIRAALLKGWVSMHPECGSGTCYAKSEAELLAKTKADQLKPPMPAFPERLLPVDSQDSDFLDVCKIVYEAAGALQEKVGPLRAIRGYRKKEKAKQDRIVAALKESVASAKPTRPRERNVKKS
jgi:hypothetical protein